MKGRFQSLKELRIQISSELRHEYAKFWVICCIIIHNLVIDIEGTVSERWSEDGMDFRFAGVQGHDLEDGGNCGRDGEEEEEEEEEDVDETGNGTLLNVEPEQFHLDLMEQLFRTWPFRRN